MEVILTEDAATVPIDFVAGNIDILVIVDVVAPVAIITAASAVPAVAAAAYRIAVVMADAVVIVPIIVISPFHDAPGQKPAHYGSGCEVGPGIGA